MLMLTMVDTTVLATEPTDMDILMDTEATDTDTTLARGPLMLSPPLMLMLTMVDTTAMLPPMPTDMPTDLMPTLPTPMVDTDPTWGNLPKPNQRLISNNEIKSSREGV